MRFFMGSKIINDLMTEQQLVNYALGYLNGAGHFVWRNNSGVSRSRYTSKSGVTKDRMWRAGIKGGSDIIGISKSGHFIAVECKIGRNKPTELQLAFLAEIGNRRGYACVAYTTDDIDRLIKLLESERG